MDMFNSYVSLPEGSQIMAIDMLRGVKLGVEVTTSLRRDHGRSTTVKEIHVGQ